MESRNKITINIAGENRELNVEKPVYQIFSSFLTRINDRRERTTPVDFVEIFVSTIKQSLGFDIFNSNRDTNTILSQHVLQISQIGFREVCLVVCGEQGTEEAVRLLKQKIEEMGK